MVEYIGNGLRGIYNLHSTLIKYKVNSRLKAWIELIYIPLWLNIKFKSLDIVAGVVGCIYIPLWLNIKLIVVN